jgi:tRNA-2-methylthio-N6-dimethylallyladenosine synthase
VAETKGEGVKSFVTVMRGCDNFCSYCIVPYVRGREVSRQVTEIIGEVKELAAMGVKEITLVGQNVNSYAGEVSFPELIKKISNEVDDILRIRFVTSHPKDISVELIELFGEVSKLVSSLHLPVQSGSTSVLKRMGRGYSVEEYRAKIDSLKGLYPDIAITTDIIVGFPGESEEDFFETMALIEDIRFDSIFSFRYSPRPGTKAAEFTDTVDEVEGKRRLDILQARQKVITAEKLKALVGGVNKVLVEGPSKAANDGDDELQGRTPCNRVVNFSGDEALIGTIVDVQVVEAFTNSLKGTIFGGAGKEEKGAA